MDGDGHRLGGREERMATLCEEARKRFQAVAIAMVYRQYEWL